MFPRVFLSLLEHKPLRARISFTVFLYIPVTKKVAQLVHTRQSSPKNAPEVLTGIWLNLYIIVTEKYDKFLHLFISCHNISNTNLDFFLYINLFGQISLKNIFQVQWHFTLSQPLTQHRPLQKHLTGLWLTLMPVHQFICHIAAELTSLKLKSDSITPLLKALE